MRPAHSGFPATGFVIGSRLTVASRSLLSVYDAPAYMTVVCAVCLLCGASGTSKTDKFRSCPLTTFPAVSRAALCCLLAIVVPRYCLANSVVCFENMFREIVGGQYAGAVCKLHGLSSVHNDSVRSSRRYTRIVALPG